MRYIFLLSLCFLFACSANEKVVRRIASIDLPPLEQGEIWDETTTQEAEEILDNLIGLVIKLSSKDSITRRDAHAKAHGCVKANFTVDNSKLPLKWRKGLFSENKKYDAWIRYSNGLGEGINTPDLKKDIRGMAIKIMNVENTPTGVHDILLGNNRNAFAVNASDFLELTKVGASGSKLKLAQFAITHPLNALRALEAQIQIGNLLKQDYHSSVPYKLSDNHVRYRAVPCNPDRDAVPDKGANANYLRQRLVTSLAKNDFCFDFYVQPNMNPKVQKLEDPRIDWDDKTSPPIKVGQINIFKQTGILSQEQVNLCENINFNPWHSLAENRPMGQLNRVRSLVYEHISIFRHRNNRTQIIEPENFSPCIGKTASLCAQPKQF
jgi:hypothetical protein